MPSKTKRAASRPAPVTTSTDSDKGRSESPGVGPGAATPGPWRWFNHIHDSRVGNERFEQRISDEPSMKYLIGADGQGFAHTVGLREPRDRANAYLLAAAPDLKAACEAAESAIGATIAAHESDPFRSHLDPAQRFQGDLRNSLGLLRAALALANGGGA